MENQSTDQNWHQKHQENLSRGDKIADRVAVFMGSWKFIILQAVFMALWALMNTLNLLFFKDIGFDHYPFVFLNLAMSAEAAFATPLIMMAQNRQSSRDKTQAEHQYEHSESELKFNTKITGQLLRLTEEIHRKTVGEAKE